MDSFIKDYDKILKKHRALDTNDPLDRLIAVVNEAKEKIRADPSSATTSLAVLGKSIKTTSNGISDEYKELQSALTKYSKAIDKKFTGDMMTTINSRAFDNKERILRNTVALHFIRQGNFEVGDMFAKEAGLTIPDSIRDQFVEMFEIVAALKESNLEPALDWAMRNRNELEKKSSTLEFKLHRLRFLQLLEARQTQDAVLYARQNFKYFGNRHTQEIQRLMCSIIYMNNINASPYADLIAPNFSYDIQHMFTRDFCSLIGLSCESPLYVSVTVGTQALPTMNKMASIMKAKKAEWSQQSELPPVEISLTDDTKFHSIFACPVSKEQATEENPPMMMLCGHVVCKESLQKLCKGLSSIMDAADEPYDFLTWHSNAPVAKDEKKEKKKLKKQEKEAKEKASKAAKKDTSKSKSKKDSKKRRSAQSDDESNDSDSDDDDREEEDEASVKKSKASKKKQLKESLDSESESSESDSSSEESDDPDTQPPPKSKKKKNKKKNKKKAGGAGDNNDEAEAPENEDGEGEEGVEGKKKEKKSDKKAGPGRKGEFGIWIGNLSFLTTEKSLRHFFRNVGADITRVNMPSGSGYNKKGNKGFAYVDFASLDAQTNAIKLSETELDGRKVLIKSSKSYEGRPVLSKGAVQEKATKQKHAVSPTLFIGNLSFQTTREGLQKLFEDCGEIRKVRLATFEDSGKCKGFGYIDYMNPESATTALTNPKKYFLDGRKLNIEYASAEATLKGNPREYRKHKRDEEDAAAVARGEVPAPRKEGANADDTDAAADAEEERRKFNSEQKAKRQRRQPGEAPVKKLQGHQRPGLALANAQRAPQGIVEFKGSKVTF
ncbi:hypothetical protein BGX27_007122 [Mortierella sp. AM989]|nr:hypothetical protein BGX27_007122 [Mortierella sp. AM989]